VQSVCGLLTSFVVTVMRLKSVCYKQRLYPVPNESDQTDSICSELAY